MNTATLNRWMNDTGRTPKSLAAELGISTGAVYRWQKGHPMGSLNKAAINGLRGVRLRGRDALAAEIALHLKTAGLKVPQFACQMGISHHTLYRWLNGEGEPSNGQMAKLRQFLDGPLVSPPPTLAAKPASDDRGYIEVPYLDGSRLGKVSIPRMSRKAWDAFVTFVTAIDPEDYGA